MGSPYGLKIVQSCSAPLSRKGEAFCDSLASSLKVLDTIIPPVAYSKGAVLLMEGQTPSGIFAVCSGQVKLSTASLEGKAIILKIAEAGELLGLPATLSGIPYEVTTEVSEQTLLISSLAPRFCASCTRTRGPLSRWLNS
jgi:CRP/FNR family transcriptional regulator, cyclic AMP receptor protein